MARAVGRMKGVLSQHKNAKHAKDFDLAIDAQRKLNNTVGFIAKGGVTSAKKIRLLGLAYPKLAYGLHWIHRIRVNAVYTYRDTVRLNCEVKLPAGSQCPCCCKVRAVDSLVHFLFECSGPTVSSLVFAGSSGLPKATFRTFCCGSHQQIPPQMFRGLQQRQLRLLLCYKVLRRLLHKQQMLRVAQGL
jgi:hypothetical protein